jgi:hypothetical protein
MQPVLIYEHTDIPPGMSCAEYRRVRHPRRPRRRLVRLVRPHGRKRA